MKYFLSLIYPQRVFIYCYVNFLVFCRGNMSFMGIIDIVNVVNIFFLLFIFQFYYLILTLKLYLIIIL